MNVGSLSLLKIYSHENFTVDQITTDSAADPAVRLCLNGLVGLFYLSFWIWK